MIIEPERTYMDAYSIVARCAVICCSRRGVMVLGEDRWREQQVAATTTFPSCTIQQAIINRLLSALQLHRLSQARNGVSGVALALAYLHSLTKPTP